MSYQTKMPSKERLRLEFVGKVGSNELAMVKAPELAVISLQQMLRVCQRHWSEGTRVVQRSRRRYADNRLPDKTHLKNPQH